MTLIVRYVELDTFLITNELLKLIQWDATDGSAKRLFEQFSDALDELQIALEQID